MISDIAADSDRCQHCGELLHKHFSGHELSPTLRFYDGDIVDAVMSDVWCSNCGYVNDVFWQAWLPTTANMKRLMAEYEGRRRGN